MNYFDETDVEVDTMIRYLLVERKRETDKEL